MGELDFERLFLLVQVHRVRGGGGVGGGVVLSCVRGGGLHNMTHVVKGRIDEGSDQKRWRIAVGGVYVSTTIVVNFFPQLSIFCLQEKGLFGLHG